MGTAETITRSKAKTASAVNAGARVRAMSGLPVGSVRLLGVCKVQTVRDGVLRGVATKLLSTSEGRRALIKAADAMLKGSAGVPPADEGRPDPRHLSGQPARRRLSARGTRALPANPRPPVFKPKGTLL